MSAAAAMPPPATALGEGRPGLRRLLILTGPAILVFAILCSLGTWQLQRLAWKEALIAKVESRIGLDPVPAPGPASWGSLDLAEADYTPVALSGAYLNDREVHAFASLTDSNGPLGGHGFFVLTPFRTADGWTVIVNRGFVPTDRKDPATRPEGQIEGETELVGLLRPPQGRNPFTPADNVAGDVWFTRDPAPIAAHLGLPADEVAPYLIDARLEPLPGGLPQGGETIVSFPNSHLGYVVTWFGLALALAGMFGTYAVSVLRGRAGRADRQSS
jgi:surfeit locus 1 family protein